MKKITASKDSFQRSYQKLLRHVMQTGLGVGRKDGNGELRACPYKTEWQLGAMMREFPENCLVVPTMIDCDIVLGWYRGKDDEGNYLVEDALTHSVWKLYNCSFDFNEELSLGQRHTNDFYWSDWHWEVNDIIRNLYRPTRFSYPIRLCFISFSDDDSEVTLTFRKIFEDDFFDATPVKVNELLRVSKKNAETMFEEILKTSGVLRT